MAVLVTNLVLLLLINLNLNIYTTAGKTTPIINCHETPKSNAS